MSKKVLVLMGGATACIGDPSGKTELRKIVTPILSFFGLAKETPAEPYTQAEGEAAYSAYLDRYLAEYKPCGEFGGPIE